MEATADKHLQLDTERAQAGGRLAAVFGGLHHRRLLVIVLFVAIFSFDMARSTDIDFWWRLKTGELMMTSGAIPTTDPFSYTANGQPWITHEWLWVLTAFFLYEHGGYVLAMLVSAALVTATYLILYRLMRRLGANEIVSGALVLWAAVLALPCIGVRPRELTHLFLSYYLSRLLLYRAGAVRHLWPLPPLMVLWVNLHGGFVLGIGIVALFAIAQTARWLFSNGTPPRHLFVVGLLTVAATLVNPDGPWMFLHSFDFRFGAENQAYKIVTEFQSPDFHVPLNQLFAAGVVGLLLLGGIGRRGRLEDAMLIAAFVPQALISTRQVAVCALVLAPLLAQRLCEHFWFARELPPARLPRALIVLNWIILIALALSGVAYAARPKVFNGLQLGREPKVGQMPVGGARYIEDHDLPGPVFNAQVWGGYLIYRWYPRRLVFIDGRIAWTSMTVEGLYRGDVVNEYLQVASIQPTWRDVLNKYGVRTVLSEKGSALSTLLLTDGHWDRVFQGEVEDVFVKRD